MTPQEQKVVEQIAQGIMARLHAAGAPTDAVKAGDVAPINPPVGTCTGDYSKFAELQGSNIGAGKPSTAANEVLPLSGIITANQLQDAMTAAADGIAQLAPDARLTPLAADFVREHPKSIVRVDRSSTTTAAQQPPNANSWLWWIDGSCPAAEQTVKSLGGVLRASSAPRSEQAIVDVVRELASAVKSHRVIGGILFVAHAARAMCYANRCLNLRAVIGTCDETIEQGIKELGANVLVIEYPYIGQSAMAAMVNRFVQQPPSVPSAVERTLAELHRC